MGLLPLDFESSAYTNFATSARTLDNKTLDRPRQDRARYFGAVLTIFALLNAVVRKILR